MKFAVALALLLATLPCAAQQQVQQEIQRALIQRDQQSAEFAAGLRGPSDRAALETLHAQQLRDVGRGLGPDPVVARQMQGYERQNMANERELRLSAPLIRRKPDEQSLGAAPLPAGISHAVDPVPAQGTPH